MSEEKQPTEEEKRRKAVTNEIAELVSHALVEAVVGVRRAENEFMLAAKLKLSRVFGLLLDEQRRIPWQSCCTRCSAAGDPLVPATVPGHPDALLCDWCARKLRAFLDNQAMAGEVSG